MPKLFTEDRLKSIPEVSRWLMSASRAYRTQIILNLLLGLAYVLVGLTNVWATKLCVDLATSVPHAGWTLYGASAFLVSMMTTEVLLVYASRWIRALLGVRSKNRLQERIFRKVLKADWLVLHHQHSGGLTNRLTKDVDDVSQFLSEQLSQLVTSLAQFVGAFCFLYVMDNRLAIVVVVVIPVMVACAHAYMRKMRRYSHDVRNQEQEIQAFLQESVQHSLVLKTLEKITRTDEQLVESHRQLQGLIRRNTRYSATAVLVVNMSFTVGYLIAFFWGIYSLNRGLITFGAMLAFIQLVNQIQNPVRTLVNYVGIFITTFTAAERLMEVEAYPTEEEQDATAEGLTSEVDIELKDVCFGYPDGKEVLKNVNAVFPSGSVTALVGRTGSGKTTLISILLGLYKASSGTAEAVSGSRRVALTRSTRYLFSYVPQGNTLFSGTIRQNLQLGKSDATDDEMWHALELAQADFVKNKPDGLDTYCSERGGGLSEGQAQRIGIARALLRKTPVLLLDEAFSSLDSATAHEALQAILKDDPKRTLIYITHRDALVPMAGKKIEI